MRWALLGLAIGLAALVAPSSASAATQIGETFTPTSGCGGEGGVALQTVSPAGQYAAPTAGVITSWSLQADAFPPRLKLKVARPAGGNDFTIVGESEVQTTSANQLNTFPTQISVEAGDLIGEVRVGSGDCGRNEPGYFTQFLGQRSASGKQEHLWHPIQLPAGPVGHPRARLRWRRVWR
jgi:hypothetical protein